MNTETLFSQYSAQSTDSNSKGHIDRHQDSNSLEYPYDHTDWHSDNVV